MTDKEHFVAVSRLLLRALTGLSLHAEYCRDPKTASSLVQLASEIHGDFKGHQTAFGSAAASLSKQKIKV